MGFEISSYLEFNDG